jgi:hypothetical protein
MEPLSEKIFIQIEVESEKNSNKIELRSVVDFVPKVLHFHNLMIRNQ